MTKNRKSNYLRNIGAGYQVMLWTLFYIVFHHAFFEEFGLEQGTKNTFVYTIVFITYVLLSFFNIKILLPIFFGKKYKLYGLYLFATLLIVSIILNVFVLNTLDIKPKNIDSSNIGWVSYYFFFGLIYVGLGSFFQFYKHWHELRENIITYEKEKVDAELTALKAQINPHLLFNSLNNIYSLSLDKSDKTPEMILKLADLMSYVLYDCKNEKVNIKQEIDFIKNYVELEKQRFEDNIDIKFDLNIKYHDIEVAPLIFLPFIENAFKHVGSKINSKPYISINLTLNADHTIIFKSENSIFNETYVEKSPYSGIGIANITKRLLYLYPEQYELNLNQEEDKYSVNLKIEL